MVPENTHERTTKRGRPFEKGNQYYQKRKAAAPIAVDRGPEISHEGRDLNEDDLEDASLIQESESTNQSVYQILETMEFKDQNENTLNIRFTRVNNRRIRVQVFLNDKIEVRPVSYQGSSSAYAFWILLKGALKK